MLKFFVKLTYRFTGKLAAHSPLDIEFLRLFLDCVLLLSYIVTFKAGETWGKNSYDPHCLS